MENMYFSATVPVLIKYAHNLKALLEKGFAHAQTVGMTEQAFLESRLAPDMFPLIKQVQIATDNAKGIPARLAGATPIVLPDNETTVAELLARIDVVLEHLSTYTPDQFAGAAEAKVTLNFLPGKYAVGHDYVFEFGLANFFFHVTTAYAIMRNIGTPLGKMDYIGGMTLHDVV